MMTYALNTAPTMRTKNLNSLYMVPYQYLVQYQARMIGRQIDINPIFIVL